jgi:serine protease Do
MPLSRRWVVLGALAIGCVATNALLPPPAGADELVIGLGDRVSKLLPTVVNIETITLTKDPAAPPGTPPRRGTMFGSGFIIDAGGFILTNQHVIAGGIQVNVTVRGMPPLQAQVIYAGNRIDLAVLKVNAGTPLPAAKLGDSDTVQVGDPVVAIGNPLGIGESASAGIVSALNRNLKESIYDDFIQTDASINHGNSGGPLFALNSEVIGIDSALYAPGTETGSVGLGFALPINVVKFVVDQVLTAGRVHIGYIGAHLQPMTPELASGAGLSEVRGAIVTEVVASSPAQGIVQVGDIVLEAGGRQFADTRAVARMIAETPIGQAFPILLWRDGAQRTVSINVAEMPGIAEPGTSALPKAALDAVANPGLTGAPITNAVRAKYKLGRSQTGVVVTDVIPGGTAANSGLGAGDVIVQIGDDKVTTPAEVERDLQSLRAQKRIYALLLVQGPQPPRWVAFPLAGGPSP